MWSPNKKAMTVAEREHVDRIKRMWLVKRLTELGALNLTIQRLMEKA